MSKTTAELEKQADELYERYGRPLEPDHLGEFVAISPDGEIVLGPNLRDLAWKASEVLGPGNFIFKVGDRAVGNIR